MSTQRFKATLGGFDFLPESYEIQGGAYGSVGTASITTSFGALMLAGLDLPAISLTTPPNGFIEVAISISIDGAWAKIFGGEYVHADYDYDTSQAVIFCRDFAGVLVDQKKVLNVTAQGLISVLAPGEVADPDGVMNQNQTIAQIVTQIATQFQLKPVLRFLDQDTSPLLAVGSLYGDASDDTSYMVLPQSLWAILNRLARDTGNAVYVTPTRELVFGAPGAGTNPINLTYLQNVQPDGTVPIRNLKIQHNPRRNMSFRVLVASYDPAKAQTTRGDAYVIGTKLPGASGQSINPGLWPGTNGTIAFSLKATGQRIQLYTFHIDGLTLAQAQARAMAIALNIAQRELILHGTIDTTANIAPLETVKVQGTISPVFTGRNFFVHGFTHTGNLRDGLNTNITALDIQAFGVGEDLSS